MNKKIIVVVYVIACIAWGIAGVQFAEWRAKTVVAGAVADEITKGQERNATTAKALSLQFNKTKRLPKVILFGNSLQKLLRDNAVGDLNKRLVELNRALGTDIVWVMDESGKTVASSNWGEEKSNIGVNYSDRGYFKDAVAKGEGFMFVAGRATKEPGFVFSAAMDFEGKVVGVIALKFNIGQLDALVAESDAFMTDSNGIIVWSTKTKKPRMFNKVEGVEPISAEALKNVYQVSSVDTFTLTPNQVVAGEVLYSNPDYSTPFVRVSSRLPDYNLKINTLIPIREISSTSKGKKLLGAGVISAGWLLFTAILLAMWYIATMREANNKISGLNEELNALNKTLSTQANTDVLTGVHNRRYCEQLLVSELTRSIRHNHTFSVILADLDRFKNINDTWGHAVGDAALKHFTRISLKALRPHDFFGRWGGEEFLFVLPETELEGAVTLVNRLRDALKKEPLILNDSKIDLTASYGVVAWGKEMTIDSLLTQADGALYKAKETRDTIVIVAVEA